MPFVKINKSNAWTAWQQGLIAGMNADFQYAAGWLRNLAVARGINAVRVFMNYNDGGYWLIPKDYMLIGNSYADDDLNPLGGPAPKGWALQDFNAIHQYYNYPPGSKTIAQTAARIQEFLDACQVAGVGVILTLDWWKGEGERMWVDRPADTVDGANAYLQATTARQVQKSLAKFWMATAERFGSHPALIAYEILNEPKPAAEEGSWAQVAEQVVRAIRLKDTITPVIIDGADNGTAKGLGRFPLNSALVTQSASLKTVFTFHAYAPLGITHQGHDDWDYESLGVGYPKATYMDIDEPTPVLYPLGTPAQFEALYKPAIDFRANARVPVFVGEFSVITLTGARLFTDVGPNSWRRMVTEVQVANGQATVIMGNINRAVFPNRTGFRIEVSDKTVAEIQSAPDQARCFTNTVLVTLTPVEGASVDEAKAVNDLQIVDLPATIYREDCRYVVSLPAGAIGRTISAKAFTQDANGNSIFPAVATLTLKPTAQARSGNEAARVTYTRHVLMMCQKHGFSWAFHADSNDTNEALWRPSEAMRAELRTAAMGRKLA